MAKKRKGGSSSALPPKPGVPSSSGSFADSFAQEDDEPVKLVLKPAPERISSPFKDALGSFKKQLDEQAKQAKLDKLKPPP
ncbi:MAG: hypothetical protein JWN04_4925, partial [Myxococcaceae bacterium]|nr:hypothetical protein [Myxococcaceae bacterium]